MNLSRLVLPFFSALVMFSCSSNSKQSGESSQIDVGDYMGEHAVASAATIDSLALEADFLTVRQAVSVLVGLSEITKAEESKGSQGRKLEYMRKFIDTYEILMGRGDDFREAIEDSKATAHVDLPGIFARYRDTMASEAGGEAIEGEDGDGALGVEPTEQTQAKPDSVKPEPKEKPDSVQ